MKIGIIGAIDEEIIKLKEDMEGLNTQRIGDLVFYRGSLEGKEVVLVRSGVGKVNASLCTTLLITYFNVEGIIFSGIAGALNPRVDIGDIVISRDLLQHDFDTTATGGRYGVIPRMETSIFKGDSHLIEVAREASRNLFDSHRVWVGRILTGDQFVGSRAKKEWLRETFAGDCAEMEGAATAQVCHILNIPFLIMRSISDRADGNALSDGTVFLDLATDNSKILIKKVLERL